MSGVTVTIPPGDLQAIIDSATELGGAAGGDEVKGEMGNALVQLVRDHFAELSQDSEHHRTADRLGAAHTGFYDRAREGTHDPELEGDGVSISIEATGLAQRLLGGTIEARPGSFLTIPALGIAYGKRAREFDLRLVVFGQSAVLVPKEAKADSITKRFADEDIYYWLVRSVTQQPDPTVLPEDAEMLDAAQTNALAYIEQVWGQAA